MGTREFSYGQKKIVDRYYQNRDSIAVSKLQEIVSELAVTDAGTKADRLWKRAESHLGAIETNAAQTRKVVEDKDLQGLAKLVGALSKG